MLRFQDISSSFDRLKLAAMLPLFTVWNSESFCVNLGDAFQSLQSSFLEKHYDQFEETEENKFVYSDIHQEYVSNTLLCCCHGKCRYRNYY